MQKDNAFGVKPSFGASQPKRKKKKPSFWKRIKYDLKLNGGLYLLCVPAIIYIIIFCYVPMVGIVIAFQNYSVTKGIFGSKWIGFENFQMFFEYYYFWDIILTTLKFSVVSLVFGFPLPIIISLILNSIHSKFKEVFRVTSYIPNFLSIVVVVAMLMQMLDESNGIINQIIQWLGGKPIAFMTEPEYFLLVYVVSGLWQSAGWGTIIYTSALSNVDPQLYEAAKMDGANKFQILRYVDFPTIVPTVVVSLILAVGGLMSVGFEKVFLMQNEMNMLENDVISTYAYRTGLLNQEWGFGTAVGLFNSVINFILFATVNRIARKTSGSSIW